MLHKMPKYSKDEAYFLGSKAMLSSNYGGLALGCVAKVTVVDTSTLGIPGPSRIGETVVLGTESLPDGVIPSTFEGFDIKWYGEFAYVRCYSPEHNDVWWYPADGLYITGQGPTIDTIIPLGSEKEGTDG